MTKFEFGLVLAIILMLVIVSMCSNDPGRTQESVCRDMCSQSEVKVFQPDVCICR